MNTLAQVSDLKLTETELIEFLLQHSQQTTLPIAFWKLPDSPLKQVVISREAREIEPSQMFEDLDPGFLLAPFSKSKNRYFLPADHLFTFEGGLLKPDGSSGVNSSIQWLKEKIRSYNPSKKIRLKGGPITAPGGHKEPFIKLIQRCVDEIERGSFQKIVPSRTKHIELPENFDIVQSFQKLCTAYPQAFISFVSIPGVGNWLGATPEVLVCVESKSIFKTVALAGTLPYHEGINLKSVAWTQKEIEEQALVERYVISCFKKIRIREYDEYGPRTVIAGNLMHLKSEFTVDLKATNFPQMGSVMLQLLHPTSAVCGMPLDSTLSFLQEHEGYDREFYAGYLGPINMNDNVNIFVNLRCMQITDDHGILYAGAGVTIDSVPEEEWAETEIKFNTLLNVIL